MYLNNFPQELKETIKAEALNLGFCVVGFTTPDEMNDQAYQNWLSRKYYAGMTYLASEKTLATRKQPKIAFPACKTIISLGAIYNNPGKDDEQEIPATAGRIAHYASGLDYHQILAQKIEQLMEKVNSISDIPINFVSAVDTKPLPERDLAVKAGLGWISKNGMLTNPQYGSALFLSEILLDVELPPDQPFTGDLCGSCTKCIDACPTGCIQNDRTINANNCISYLTIEHRGVIPEDFFDAMNESVFGCDKCLQVCPWNKKAKSNPIMKEFIVENKSLLLDIPKNLEKIITAFHRNFELSAIRRAGKQGFLRNCMIRLSQNPTKENMEIIDKIVDNMPNTYLCEQKQLIYKFIKSRPPA